MAEKTKHSCHINTNCTIFNVITWAVLGSTVTFLASARAGGEARSWHFNRWCDTEGWTVPEHLTGAVTGGALWLTIQPTVNDPNYLAGWQFQMFGGRMPPNPGQPYINSPQGLNIPSSSVKKVQMRILNLSPETDGFLAWRTTDKPQQDAGVVRFTFQPDCKQWQEVTCHVDDRWTGTIDRIRLNLALLQARGDIWIDWIKITDGPVQEPAPRPDVCSDKVVPRLSLPGISQADFHDAFNVLDECLITNVPVHGFAYHVMAPGGAYGENWWQLDSSLNVAGAKWANQTFAENVMRGFFGIQAQVPDGHIPLYGGSVRGQPGCVSSVPRYFEAAYDVARRTSDTALRKEIYLSMRKYLDWWLSPVKTDPQTGLVTATAEETFSEPQLTPQTVAPVDLNVAVALGCHHVSHLADSLRRATEARKYADAFNALKKSINHYMWNEQADIYFNYNVKQKKQLHRLLCTTFDPMRLGIAPPQAVEKLIGKLLDPRLFNWGKLPVTSIAQTEPDYVEAAGPYDGRAWLGDVWTMRNMPIIDGLEDTGQHRLAAELTWQTIKAFNANYCEYLVPSSGAGEGVQRYGWSASQYIQAVIEHLFGIDYDHIEKRLRIVPHVPDELAGRQISISELILPPEGKRRLSLTVHRNKQGSTQLTINIRGPLPEGSLEVFLPEYMVNTGKITDESGQSLAVIRDLEDLVNVLGVRLPMTKSLTLRFD